MVWNGASKCTSFSLILIEIHVISTATYSPSSKYEMIWVSKVWKSTIKKKASFGFVADHRLLLVAGAAIPNPERAMTAGIPIMMQGCTKD